MNLHQRVLAVVLSTEEVSISQVLATVGRYIDASHAYTAGRRLRRNLPNTGSKRRELVDRGRRHIVSHALCRLRKLGKVRRVRRGVYGPPLPRIFKAS